MGGPEHNGQCVLIVGSGMGIGLMSLSSELDARSIQFAHG